MEINLLSVDEGGFPISDFLFFLIADVVPPRVELIACLSKKAERGSVDMVIGGRTLSSDCLPRHAVFVGETGDAPLESIDVITFAL